MHIYTDQALFISDLHLDKNNLKLNTAFIKFITGLQQTKNTTVFILGDLFESWIGDDAIHNSDDPWLLQIINLLQLVSRQMPTYFVHGNRDFLVGASFTAATGIQCLPEVTQVDFKGFQLSLCHGDHLCTQDTDYMAFRQLVRSPNWQANFLAKPLSERQLIAEHLRQQSASAHQTKTQVILDVDPSAVAALLDATKPDLLIHGHTHRPEVHAVSQSSLCPRIVLGDWAPTASWLKLETHQFNTSALHSKDPQLLGELFARDWHKTFKISPKLRNMDA